MEASRNNANGIRPIEPELHTAPVVLIYIPGVIEPPTSGDDFAHRLAIALDEETAPESATYSVQPRPPSPELVESSFRVHRITRTVGGQTEVVADIFRLEYENLMRRRFDKASPVRRSLLLLSLVLYSGLFHFLPAILRSREKSGKAKAELIFASLVFFALSLYTVFILVAAIHAGWRLTHSQKLGALQYVALSLATLGSLLPGQVRNSLVTAAAGYYAALSYLATGQNRSSVASRLSGLFKGIADQTSGDVKIFVVGYSFGSIIALDFLFPLSGETPRRTKAVKGLVTIGCPFDLVRSLWSDYFSQRGGFSPRSWLNIFAPLDVLGSNFIDGNETAREPNEQLPVRRRRRRESKRTLAWAGIQLRSPAALVHPENTIWESGPPGQRLTWLNVLSFSGLKVHTMYWDMDNVDDTGCLGAVARHIWGEASTPVNDPEVLRAIGNEQVEVPRTMDQDPQGSG